jgi:hypothetical protein
MTTIYPYLRGFMWVFDDQDTGLKSEPFVSGASEAISHLVEAKRIPNAAHGFSLSFSDQPFYGHDAELSWLSADDSTDAMPGNWYRGVVSGQEMEAWLCPALLDYFPAAPEKLFLRADPLPEGVDPVWHIAADDPRQHRFMSGDEA